jgi:hypothetical protein
MRVGVELKGAGMQPAGLHLDPAPAAPAAARATALLASQQRRAQRSSEDPVALMCAYASVKCCVHGTEQDT